MARLLNSTGYVSSVLAAVCLCLAVLAAPIGMVQADVKQAPLDPTTCDVGCGLAASPGCAPIGLSCLNLAINGCAAASCKNNIITSTCECTLPPPPIEL